MDDDSGLLNINLSDTDSDSPSSPPPPPRTDQTEAAFQAVKASYTPKLQNSNLCKTISLPLGPGASKPQIQDLLHAVEELYFFRRYDEAIVFLGKVLSEKHGDAGELDDESRALLNTYQDRCRQKLEKN